MRVMYTVLIADDEQIERDGIRCLLTKEKDKYRILEAENEREAEEALRKYDIDILLADIGTPKLSGLALTERAGRMKKDIQTIVFSKYQNFEYAKTAIRCGANDYLLKPVDSGEFERALKRAEDNLRMRHAQIRRNESSSKYLEQYFLARYLLKKNPDVLREAKNCVDTKQWESFHYMIFAECGNEFFEEYADEFQNALREKYGNTIVYLNLNMCQGIFLIRGEVPDSYGMAVEMLEWLKETYRREFFLAVSRRYETFTELPDVYCRLEELMEEKFYHTQRHIFCETMKDTGESMIDEGRTLWMLERDIREKDTGHLESHFQKVVEKYSDSRYFPSMYVKFIFSNIVKELWDSMAEYKDIPISQVIDDLYRSKSVAEVIELVQEQVDDFLQYVAEDKGSRKFKVEITKDYIDKHYGDTLDLEKLAKRVYMTSGHLSKSFKKETGVSLIQYIKNVRMEKAACMAAETDMPVNEICTRAGFRNLSYFCKCFREQYGYTPENYRKYVLKPQKAKMS